ncbi:poly ADP-ribose polymerase 14 [Chrysochromulina tobinii]|uniref:Poly [ADP-ribose] polymerase n=1 Tax=Chrysochromulina tobinii TaxID=1460289 RepID=A0A0M0JGV5_9EUKA|nr:poly ADP-ribose polymerase 14 [Chrysochromulina tobinii]|eukprot:KOO25562.1 poly ADP-ribose polymerase 14 [Chrysochromulina sp. CCMP291]
MSVSLPELIRAIRGQIPNEKCDLLEDLDRKLQKPNGAARAKTPPAPLGAGPSAAMGGVKRPRPAESSGEGTMQLKVVSQDCTEVFFKCKPDTKLGKLMRAFCQRQGVAMESVRFLFDGNRIRENQTPNEEGMEDGDSIDVVFAINFTQRAQGESQPGPAHVWMWEDGAVGSGAWQLFDTASEETFRNHEEAGVLHFRIEIRGQAYDVDLSQCTQQNVRTGFVRNLKRHALTDVDKDLPSLISHIRSEARFNLYQAARDALISRIGGAQLNETWLWHGTSRNTLESIMANGFDRNMNERGQYGVGSYFSNQLEYSLREEYAKPDDEGSQWVLLVRVLVGQSCVGKKGMRQPDKKPGGGAVLYESMVDSLQKPSIFVLSTGSDNHAYPEFVLRLRLPQR